MTLDEFQKAAMRTAGHNRGNIAYSMGGIGGESGEYVDVVKKHLFHGKGRPESAREALLELGDLLWGIAQAADAWGHTLEEVAEANIAKLKRRYPQGFVPDVYIDREELASMTTDEIRTRLGRTPREET